MHRILACFADRISPGRCATWQVASWRGGLLRFALCFVLFALATLSKETVCTCFCRCSINCSRVMSQGVTVLALMLAYDCIHLLRSLALLREAASRHASNAEQSQRNGSSKARASNANGSDTASTAQAQAELQTHRALWLAFAIRCALPIAWGLGYLALRRFIAGQAIGA